jgi:hypothetical protein
MKLILEEYLWESGEDKTILRLIPSEDTDADGFKPTVLLDYYTLVNYIHN